MTHVFIQWKLCPCCGGKHFGNIRAGESAIDWGSVYDGRASVDNTDPEFALIEAYAGEYSRDHQDAIIALVNRETGKRVMFDRIVPGRPPVTLVQSENGPFGKGRIVMHKTKIHPAPTAFNADGTPNWHNIDVALHNVKEQQKAGHYTYTGSATDTANADGSADLVFTIHRVPTDAKAHAADAPSLK